MEGNEYIDNQIKWMKDYTDAEIRAIREAVDKVDKTNNAKFEAQNEWRAQMKDQTANFVTRRELTGAVVTVITLLVAVAALLLKMK